MYFESLNLLLLNLRVDQQSYSPEILEDQDSLGSRDGELHITLTPSLYLVSLI